MEIGEWDRDKEKQCTTKGITNTEMMFSSVNSVPSVVKPLFPNISALRAASQNVKPTPKWKAYTFMSATNSASPTSAYWYWGSPGARMKVRSTLAFTSLTLMYLASAASHQ